MLSIILSPYFWFKAHAERMIDDIFFTYAEAKGDTLYRDCWLMNPDRTVLGLDVDE